MVIFSLKIKSCTTKVLHILLFYYNSNIEQIDTITAYLNLDINIFLYIEILTS